MTDNITDFALKGALKPVPNPSTIEIRTEALRGALAYSKGIITLDERHIIEIAQQFEKYLRGN